MKHDHITLPLFAPEQMPPPLQTQRPGLPAHWPPAKRENFTWWCQHGDREMCAAVLWQAGGFTQGAASAMAKELAQ